MKLRPRDVFPVLLWARRVDAGTLRADLLAGLTNAAIVLPQAIAFATIAGLPPQYGLYASLVIAPIAALFGSSMVMISGPATATSVILFTTLSLHAVPFTDGYVQIALFMTIMVGVIQLGMGLAKIGNLVAFVSHSVITGFTAAAAALIMVSQLPTALGQAESGAGPAIERLINVIAAGGSVSPIPMAIAATTFVIAIVLRRVAPLLPNFLIAIILGSLLGWVLGAKEAGVSMVPAIPSAFPSLTVHLASPEQTSALFQGAVAIALLGLLEAISIGRSFALRRREPYDANQEIIGQGLSNTIGGLFQSYVGSGSFTRSGVNHEAGARTPLAAVFASLILAVSLLVVAPLLTHIPMPAIAGLLIYVAIRLVDVAEIRQVVGTSRSETVILAATFLTGLIVALDFSIYVGVIASLVIFLNRTAHPGIIVGAPNKATGVRKFGNAEVLGLPECPQVTVYRVLGPLYFGCVAYVEREIARRDAERPQSLQKILILKGVGDIDVAGADLVIDMIKRQRASGGDYHIIALYPRMLERLRRFGVLDELGPGKLHATKFEALSAALAQADGGICRTCTKRIFLECAGMPGGAVHDEPAGVSIAPASGRLP